MRLIKIGTRIESKTSSSDTDTENKFLQITMPAIIVSRLQFYVTNSPSALH